MATPAAIGTIPTAFASRGTDVAQVHDESKSLGVDVVDQLVEAFGLALRIGRVAENPERRTIHRNRRASAHQQE